MLQSLAMVVGVPPLVHWLQVFRAAPGNSGEDDGGDLGGDVSKRSPATSLVLGAGKISRDAGFVCCLGLFLFALL
jgi:hypothetical protein